MVFALTMIACAIEGLFLGVILFKCAKKVFNKNKDLDDPDIELTQEALNRKSYNLNLV